MRNTGLVHAPPEVVAAALRHTATAETALAAAGVRARAAAGTGELLVPGDELSWRARIAGLPVPLTTRVLRADTTGLSSVLVRGPLPELAHDGHLVAAGPHTRLTDAVSWRAPFGGLGRLADAAVVRRFVLRLLRSRVAVVRELAESWARRRIVVGAAIVRDGRLLVQQRARPAELAGRWELPGGRVEDGEDEQDAVVRECVEELGIGVRPRGRIGTDVPLGDHLLLRVHLARPADGATAAALEHRQVRWVGAAELGELDWLDADRVLVHSLRPLLR
ncbi:NUDIX domain-containing protein [Saccharopolyspora sp. HNM0983]|uniref:8-oxo-dGTP diphosphatase n=1 Tax=Saccharopolyspora montiporae TaxID=2781240 RepID=A0A929G0I8_9PSEU|nr:NUDIX domain-containing protein [Saccharopolyspora sp. HNM0983]MBE9375665.1 NUDIX domain-containing protein [Saccharopolyspora sp. HNM0983]